MKILLINNHTRHLPDLTAALVGHQVEIREYQPGLDFSCANKDLVILSGGGGEGLEIHDEHKPGRLWYEDEMKFIRTANKPILGICMGLEVITRAFGSPVKKLVKGVDGFVEFNPSVAGKKRFNKNNLRQFEAHDWCVPRAPKGFKVLAKSDTGIEIMEHKTRKILATQFHPEKGGTLGFANLLQSF
jgi:GMP synthase-like glutamine amidotransferase